MSVLTNIESIIKEIDGEIKCIKSMEKMDGITMECSVSQKNKYNDATTKITELLTELDLQPINIHKNTEDDKKFAVEFPDMNVIYTEEENEKFYKDSFTWLFDLAIKKSGAIKITKELLMAGKDSFEKQAIHIYFRSNVNPYKEKIEDYLNDVKYRKNLDNIFYPFTEDYCNEHHII